MKGEEEREDLAGAGGEAEAGEAEAEAPPVVEDGAAEASDHAERIESEIRADKKRMADKLARISKAEA
jgi:hypothetical protein